MKFHYICKSMGYIMEHLDYAENESEGREEMSSSGSHRDLKRFHSYLVL